MKLEFLTLAEDIIRRSNNKPIIFINLDGNWGDALIRAGAENFFRYFNIPYQHITQKTSVLTRNKMLLQARLNNQLVVVNGGGAWCNHYKHGFKLVESIQNRFKFKDLLVLPSTYSENFKIANVTFYRRDHFNSKSAMPDATFCHDMAFFLHPIEISALSETDHEGHFFRTDIEASGEIAIPNNNYDLSAQGTIDSKVSGFFEYLSRYKVINTDRLHVAIGSSIMNKTVNLQAGSYFKNKAIFKSSIEPYYPNTRFIE